MFSFLKSTTAITLVLLVLLPLLSNIRKGNFCVQTMLCLLNEWQTVTSYPFSFFILKRLEILWALKNV